MSEKQEEKKMWNNMNAWVDIKNSFITLGSHLVA
jgi:hypothetical protein